MIAMIASLLLSTNATPRELVMSCRTIIPPDVELSGRIALRNRKGIVKAEHTYSLTRSNSVTRLSVDGVALERPSAANDASILGTDVTWSDLTLDYLWWDVHGQVCAVVVMKNGDRRVRVWIDRKTGALMQAEEFDGERPLRCLWGTRIKKFGDRWMANVMEVETIGSGHRTKITVEELK